MPGQQPCITIAVKPCSPGYVLNGRACLRVNTVERVIHVEVPIWRNEYVTQRVYKIVHTWPGKIPDTHEENVVVIADPVHTFKNPARRLIGKADARHAIGCRAKCPVTFVRTDPVLRRQALERLVPVDRLKTWTPPPFVPPRLEIPDHLRLGQLKKLIGQRVRSNVRKWITHFQKKLLDKGKLAVGKGPGLTPEAGVGPGQQSRQRR